MAELLSYGKTTNPIGLGVHFDETACRDRIMIEINDKRPAMRIKFVFVVIVALLLHENLLADREGIFFGSKVETGFDHGKNCIKNPRDIV